MKKITVASGKGGCGKSTIALSLAMALAHEGSKVLMIDLDSQCNTTKRLKAQPTLDLNAIFEGSKRLKDCIIETPFVNLSLLPGSVQAERLNKAIQKGFEQKAVKNPNGLLSTHLENVTGFDYLIIDNPPNLDYLVYNGVVCSDWVLVPTDDSRDSLDGAIDLVNIVKELNKRVLGIVLNRINPRTALYNMVVKTLNKAFPGLVFDTTIRQSVLVSETSFTREIQPVFFRDPNSQIALDLLNLKNEVVKRMEVR